MMITVTSIPKLLFIRQQRTATVASSMPHIGRRGAIAFKMLSAARVEVY